MQMQLKRQASVGRPVSGSKPKKFVPAKPRYDNPSLVSNSVTALFQYPMKKQQITMIQEQTSRRSNSQYLDSLAKAQDQFLQKKDKQVSKEQLNIKAVDGNLLADKRFSHPNINMNYTPSPSPSLTNNYNYMNQHAIKTKQSHGYNIISNFAFGQ